MFDNDQETDATELDTTPGVDTDMRLTAVLSMLAAYTPLDVAAVAKSSGISTNEMLEALPASIGHNIAISAMETMFEVDSVSEFIISSVRLLHTISAGVAVLVGAGNVDKEHVSELVTHLELFVTSDIGSAAEVLAQRRLLEVSDVIDETVVRRQSRLAAKFVCPEDGYAVAASNALDSIFASDEDEDAMDEEMDEDDTPNPVLQG